MTTRSARVLPVTGVQLTALAVAVVALRGNPFAERRAHRAVFGSTAPLIVAGTAIVAAAVILVAATRYRRPATRRPAAAGPGVRQWWPAGWVLLAVAVVVVAVAVLSHVLPRPGPPAPSSAQTQTAPTVTATPVPPETTASSPATGSELLPVGFVLLPVLLAMLTAGALIARRRMDTSEPAATTRTPPTTDPLTRAAELGLDVVSAQELSPRAAIVACYAAMEQALAETPEVAPHASDTPTEVLTRAVQHHAVRTESATTLVALFAEARFSRHAITEMQRHAATAALRGVLDDLRSAACAPSP